MSMAVLASTDPDQVLSQSRELLAGDPMGYNAAGTRLADAIRHGEPGRYWIGQLHGVPTGIAVQQPADAPLVVGPMPGELAEAIARTVDAGEVALTGVFGPAGTAARFAEVWAGLRATTAVLTAEEPLYEVRDLRIPAGVAGALRRAGQADRELLLSWLPGFEPGDRWAASNRAAVFVARRLAAGDVWIWDDRGPVSMAACAETVAGASRIQAVNTPPELRGRGYASAGVAALSARVLARGLRCVLNVNVNNEAANSVYQRLGYRLVLDMRRYQLG